MNTHDTLPLPVAPCQFPISLPPPSEARLATIVSRRTGCGFAIRRSYDYDEDDDDEDDDDIERVLSRV